MDRAETGTERNGRKKKINEATFVRRFDTRENLSMINASNWWLVLVPVDLSRWRGKFLLMYEREDERRVFFFFFRRTSGVLYHRVHTSIFAFCQRKCLSLGSRARSEKWPSPLGCYSTAGRQPGVFRNICSRTRA